MNESKKTDRERMTDQKEADELSRMGTVAAEEQVGRLEVNRVLVEEYETLEKRRIRLSQEFDVHQMLVHNGQTGTMDVEEMKAKADELEGLGRKMRELESQHPDLKHQRHLMTAPDLVEAGIAKPAGPMIVDQSALTEADLNVHLKERYGFDLEAAAKDEPCRPKTVPVGMKSTEDPDRQTTEFPTRTEEELRANEAAARQVVEAQRLEAKRPEEGIRPEIVEAAARHVSLDEMEPPEDGYWWIELTGGQLDVAQLRTLGDKRYLCFIGAELETELGNFKGRLVKHMAIANPFSEARRKMRKTFDADPDFFGTYVANVAMLLHDRYNGTDFRVRGVRDEAARAILKRVFWD